MTLAACAKDIKFYSWPDITLKGIYETSDDSMCIKNISWDCDGKKIVIVKNNGNFTIIKSPNKNSTGLEALHFVQKKAVCSATFSTINKNILLYGEDNGGVHLYDINKKVTISDFKPLPATVKYLELAKGDASLAAGCISGQIFIYNSEKKPCASLVVPNSSSLTVISHSKTATNILGAASKEGVLSVWDTDTLHNKLIVKNHSNTISDIAFNDDTVSSVGLDGKFVTHDLRSCEYSSSYSLNSPIASLAFLPNCYDVALATTSGQIRSYDLRNMKGPLVTVVAYSQSVKKIRFAPVHMYSRSDVEDFKYETQTPASGDFSSVSGGTFHSNQAKTVSSGDDLHQCASASNLSLVDEADTTMEFTEFSKKLEAQIKRSRQMFEEKLIQGFYGLRINVSKQFIGAEEKISASWNNFVDYLKSTGAQSVDLNFDQTGVGASSCSEQRDYTTSYYRSD